MSFIDDERRVAMQACVALNLNEQRNEVWGRCTE